MNPEVLARDAARLVDTLERRQLQRLNLLLDVVEKDAKARLANLELGERTARPFAEQRVRQTLTQSEAARTLLNLNQSDLAAGMPADLRAAYEDGLRTSRESIAAASGVPQTQLATAAQTFGARVDLPLIQAVTESTLTTLKTVGERGLQALEEELVRAAVRGAGPRAAARGVERVVNVSRAEAERITRTVLMRTNNDARSQTFREAGVEYVRFDATNDTRTCEDCAARHGMVYKRTEAPSTPLHPNCRCVLLPYRPDQPPELRGDQYYIDTRKALREREEITTRQAGSTRKVSSRRENNPATVTRRAPFERMEDRDAPRPAFRPDGRTY